MGGRVHRFCDLWFVSCVMCIICSTSFLGFLSTIKWYTIRHKPYNGIVQLFWMTQRWKENEQKYRKKQNFQFATTLCNEYTVHMIWRGSAIELWQARTTNKWRDRFVSVIFFCKIFDPFAVNADDATEI